MIAGRKGWSIMSPYRVKTSQACVLTPHVATCDADALQCPMNLPWHMTSEKPLLKCWNPRDGKANRPR